MPEKLFLIDAMAMIYRAYFAMLSHPLTDSSGRNTSAIYGFVNSLVKILEEENPEHIAVCFDTDKPTFRHREYPAYKAQRQEIPTDMPWQIDEIKKIVRLFNIPSIELDGYEADDIIGTLVVQAEKENAVSYMVTPDKDYMQLVSDKIFLYKPARTFSGNKLKDIEIIGNDQVKERFGVPPEKVIEVLGLMGDSSDNIPGVKGVGEKTAVALIKEYGSIDNLYANIENIQKPKLKENLIRDKKNAYLAKRLVTIDTNVPLGINFHGLNRKEPDKDKLVEEFEALGMKQFARKFTISGKKIDGDTPNSLDKIVPDSVSEDDIRITIRGSKLQDDTVDFTVENNKLKTINDVKHKYYTIKNNDEYLRFIKKLSTEELFAFDTETVGLDPFSAVLVGMSFSFMENEAFYVPVFGKYGQKTSETKVKDSLPRVGVDVNFACEKLKPVLENPKIKKVGQNIKFDYLIMRNHGIEINNIFFDSMLGSYILDSDGAHNMDDLAEKYLSYKTIHVEELIGKGKNQKSMADVDVKLVSQYASEDADITLQLFHRIKYELQKINLYKICSEIEIPLVKVLAEMEFEGIKVDSDVLKKLDKELIDYIREYEDKIYISAGEKFNINSTQQLSHILFNVLKLTPTKKTKTGFSTDINVLEELRYIHPIAEQLIEYRTLTKLKSTYIDGLMNSINPKTGKVHTSFNQVAASTGRLSSINPNLQNIPIRTEAGRNIRKAFVASGDDRVIFSADYSQIELRIMAHFSGDENFINAFKRNRDIHAETAMRIFNLKSKDDITPNRRRKAKEVNFGIIYGIGAFGLATRLDIKNSEAKEIIERYFKEFPKVYEYMENTKKFARENGYVKTLLGRRRYLRQINNKNNTVRAEDERAAINMPIQGTAADMIKLAMINIYDSFMKNKLKSKMLLQVHDELVFEVLKSELETVEKIVVKEMKNAIKLDVPVEVETGYGKNWFDAH